MVAEEIDLRESRAARGIRHERVGEVAENARIAVINASVDQELLFGFDRYAGAQQEKSFGENTGLNAIKIGPLAVPTGR